MIDAWDVYWVMQLDAFGGLLITLSVSLAMVGGYKGCTALDNGEEVDRASKQMIAVAVILLVLNAALPSSKTAAAMIVLPAITSDTVVQTVAPEARELYELAKEALRSVAKDKAAEPKAAE